MESTLQKPVVARESAMPKAIHILFWAFTALFCLEMSFTAYYELLPQGALAFARLGFTGVGFRMELSLVSAMIAHASISDRPLAFVPSSLTTAPWAPSYPLWHRLSGSQAS